LPPVGGRPALDKNILRGRDLEKVDPFFFFGAITTLQSGTELNEIAASQ